MSEHVPTAHTLYASYSSVVSSGEASVKDLTTMVNSIKDSDRCNCLACKIVTTMCVTCNSEDEYILTMCKDMTEADAWVYGWSWVGGYLCPFGSDRRSEIVAAGVKVTHTPEIEPN